MTILIWSLIFGIIGLAMLCVMFWGHLNGTPPTWRQISLSAVLIFLCLGCIIHHNITKDGQEQVKLSNLKKVVSTKKDVKFYTFADNTIRTVESFSSDTSLVFSGNKVFKIKEVRIID